MNIVIKIIYNVIEADSKTLRNGLFPLKGRSNEEVALDFWKWIKDEEPLDLDLIKVTVDGDHDITEKVKKLEKSLLE